MDEYTREQLIEFVKIFIYLYLMEMDALNGETSKATFIINKWKFIWLNDMRVFVIILGNIHNTVVFRIFFIRYTFFL